jgi:hypothetical protein
MIWFEISKMEWLPHLFITLTVLTACLMHVSSGSGKPPLTKQWSIDEV